MRQETLLALPSTMQIDVVTCLLMENPADLLSAQLFNCIANQNHDVPDCWVTPVSLIIHNANSQKAKAKNTQTVVQITPLSALIHVLRSNLNCDCAEENKEAWKKTCQELIRALGKLCKKSRDTDWEPLLTEDPSDSSLNELMNLILKNSKSVVLNYIAKEILKKASQDAIKAISDSNRKKLDSDASLSEIVKIIKKRMPIIITKTPELVIYSPQQTISSNASITMTPSSQNNAICSASISNIKYSAAPANSAKKVIRRICKRTHNPYSLFQPTIPTRKNIGRSSLTRAFDPQGLYS